MTKKPVIACVIIIGNEILSGRTQDKNLQWLAEILNENGVQITESRIIPDVRQVIVDTVNFCRKNFDYVITTGGIGPTHDDITTECVAEAFGVDLIINPEIKAMVHSRPAPDEVMKARMRMAQVPVGAELVRPETGGAPGYRVANVFVLAGIPSIMQAMSKSMVTMIAGGESMQSLSIDAYLTESTLAAPLQAVQDRYPEVSLGSYPFHREGVYGTSLVMRGIDPKELNQVKTEVQQMLDQLGHKAS